MSGCMMLSGFIWASMIGNQFGCRETIQETLKSISCRLAKKKGSACAVMEVDQNTAEYRSRLDSLSYLMEENNVPAKFRTVS
jgi:hypothetical protein